MFIDKDNDGNITGIFVRKQYDKQEELPDNDLEVLAFINRDTISPEEKKIQKEVIKLNREAAIQSLKDKGELPIDYIESTTLEV